MKLNDATPFCKVCFKEIEYTPSIFLLSNPCLCKKCFEEFNCKWMKWKEGKVKCLALYDYNEKIRNTLYRFKGCGDIELKDVFFAYPINVLKLIYHGYVVVPAPSSASHNEERGYNQVIEMCKILKLPILNILLKTKESKQSDLSFYERQKVNKIIALKEKVDLSTKKILFVDDVFTTGSTTRACLNLLEKLHPKKLSCLIMAKTKFKF